MAVFLFLLVVPVARTAADPSVPTKVATIEGITEYRLSNGLRVLLFPDLSTPNVTVNLTVLVGSRHEGYGETGMAHLLEHMVFKGTPTHPDIPKALRDHGARFNGTTGYDRTNYFETLSAGDDNLEFALRLEADRLVNSFIKGEDLASEMTVVRNEFEMGENQPHSILLQRMFAAAYEWHNYGKPTIGNRSDIERVPIRNLQEFYRKYYQPDNAILALAGNFHEPKALTLIAKYFGKLPRPARRLEKTYTEEPAQDGERSVVLRRVGKVGMVGAAYHIPAASHEDFAAVQVLANVLAMQPSGRLYQALVATKKASSVMAVPLGCHDPGILLSLAEVAETSSLTRVSETLTGILERLASQKLTPEEVERAKVRLLKQRELLMKDTNRIGIELSDWAARGDWRLFFLHRDRLEKVTPADVSRVATRYLSRSNRTLGMYIPTTQSERAAIPPVPDLAALVKDYKGGRAIAPGESFDPTPENIEKRVRRSELPGGVKLALLPRKSRGAAVVLELTLRYGNPESLRGLVSASQFLSPLMARGTIKHSRQQIEDELDRLKARLSPGGSSGALTFTLECQRDRLPAALALLGEILRQPSFPPDELDILKRQGRDALSNNLNDPQALGARALQRKLSPYAPHDVRYVPTLAESIERLDRVTLHDVRKLYTNQLGATAGEIAVVGDFDPEATPSLLSGLLQGWNSATPYQRIEQQAHVNLPGERIVILTPDKANAIYLAGASLALKDSDPDYAALLIGNFLFGGAPLASRLSLRVRGKEGLSYGVRSQLSADSLDPAGRFLMFAIANPQNIAKVNRAIAEELEKMLKQGVSPGELDEVRKAYLQQMKVNRSTDSQLADPLQGVLYAGRTFAYYAELEKKIQALTPAQVNEAFRKHIVPGRLAIVEAGDFQKK
jgi:zinc protease